jgi:hypothetical protein
MPRMFRRSIKAEVDRIPEFVAFERESGGEVSRVELHDAYCWDCDDCGTENFVRAISEPVPSDPKAREALREELEEAGYIDPGGEIPDGLIMTYPDVVTCRECQVSFETEHAGEY